MNNKNVKYIIERLNGGQGFYIDIYVGYRLFKTKTAKTVDELNELLDNLEAQLIAIGFKKQGE